MSLSKSISYLVPVPTERNKVIVLGNLFRIKEFLAEGEKTKVVDLEVTFPERYSASSYDFYQIY